MPVIERSVTTGLAPDDAYDYVADFANIDEWDPGVIASHPVHDGPPQIGSAYALQMRYGRAEMRMTYRVTEMDRPRVVVLRGEGERARAADRIAFEPVPGGTRIDYRAEIEMKGLLRLVQPFLGGLMRRIGDGAAEGLSDRLAEMERGG